MGNSRKERIVQLVIVKVKLWQREIKPLGKLECQPVDYAHRQFSASEECRDYSTN